ncbi:hypothetical protein [Amycolatopsis speibonae]|uniref:Helix-turn-helix DNA binding domain protein n=1 Tax=Amycolatopsis speibonae TaxID=1450224 RepID=A0ABV7P8D5_9PSEU
MMQLTELESYLGDFANDITSEQKDTLMRISDELDEKYPQGEDFDEYQDEREEAFSTAVQYVMGDLDVDSVGRNLMAARFEMAKTMAAAHAMTLAAAGDESEASLARKLGVDRMTVRKWLGKR